MIQDLSTIEITGNSLIKNFSLYVSQEKILSLQEISNSIKLSSKYQNEPYPTNETKLKTNKSTSHFIFTISHF